MAPSILALEQHAPQPVDGLQPLSALLGGVAGQFLSTSRVEHAGARDGGDGRFEGGEVLVRDSDVLREPCRLTRVGRFTVDCVVHGRVLIDEYSAPAVCPRASEGTR